LTRDSTVTIGQITDGTTNTIMAGEDSAWHVNGATLVDENNSRYYGFQMGGQSPGSTNSNNAHGLATTIIYAVGDRTYSTATTDGRGQAGENHSFTSMHRGGAHVLRVDGGTRFLSDGIGLPILQYLGCRDDKQTLRVNPLID
jgi:hypothetical protein